MLTFFSTAHHIHISDNHMQTLQELQSKNGVKSRVTLRWGHIGAIQISVD